MGARTRTRRLRLPVLVLLAVVLGLSGCGRDGGEPTVHPPDDTEETTPGAEATPGAEPPVGGPWPEVALEPAWEGFDQPLYLTSARDGTGRLFVVEKTGRIRVIDDDEVLDEPFLDISDRVSGGSEQGLLCVAFPPDFGRRTDAFYVNYTDPDGDTIVARYRAPDGGGARPDSAEVVLRIAQPFPNHNGGMLLFDRDGYLLIGTGDGGSAGDPQGNAQDRTSLLGKILRIDVGERTAGARARPATHSIPGPAGAAYEIPGDNPYARHERFRPEIWAYGLRNPWRFSIDAENGDLYVADVGQDAWEEVNVVRGLGPPGANYGWNLLEGTHPFPPGGEAPDDPDRFIMPVVEYGHDLGRSITGGVVYRGHGQPRSRAIYFYADFVSGRLWGLRNALTAPENSELAQTDRRIASFGADEEGEVYAVDLAGTVLRLEAR